MPEQTEPARAVTGRPNDVPPEGAPGNSTMAARAAERAGKPAPPVAPAPPSRNSTLAERAEERRKSEQRLARGKQVKAAEDKAVVGGEAKRGR